MKHWKYNSQDEDISSILSVIYKNWSLCLNICSLLFRIKLYFNISNKIVDPLLFIKQRLIYILFKIIFSTLFYHSVLANVFFDFSQILNFLDEHVYPFINFWTNILTVVGFITLFWSMCSLAFLRFNLWDVWINIYMLTGYIPCFSWYILWPS